MGYIGALPYSVSQGATGVTTITGVVTGNGTSPFTGQSITAFNTVVGGASNALVGVSPGTSSDPLTSNGASANPSYRVSGSCLYTLGSTSGSGVGSISFTGLITSNFKCYILRYYYYAPATNNSIMQIRFSNDNGSSYFSTNYLAGTSYNDYTTGTLTNTTATDGCRVTGPQTNSNSIRSAGELFIMNCQSSAYVALVGSTTTGTTTTISYGRACGTYTAGTNINAVRIISSSGNITSGTYTFYGLKES
jgi:hypothetical protein